MSRHSYSNIGRGDGDIPRSDIAGGFSNEPSNYTEERANPMADDGGLRPGGLRPVGQTGVGDHNEKIREGGLKKYTGVSVLGSKWVAGVSNSNSERKKYRIHLGTFPTAEMAAIAYDTSTLFLRGDASTRRLNFPQYSSDIKNVIKGCSSSDLSDANIKFVAWKGADQLGPLLSPDKNDRGLTSSSLINPEAQKNQGLEVSPVITLQQRDHQGLEFSTAIPAAASSATSVQMSSFNSGMSHSTSNADYPLSGANNKKISPWKDAKGLAPLMSRDRNQGLEVSPLISVEQRDQGFEVSPFIGLGQYDEEIEVLAALLDDTSPPTISSITGMFDSTSTVDFPVVPSHVNQRTEAVACATGSNRRAITSAQQLPTQIRPLKRDRGLDVSAPIANASSNATSAPMISTNRGMPYSTSNTDFRVSNANFSLDQQRNHGLEVCSPTSLDHYDEGMDVLAQILAATSGAPSTPTITSNTCMFDSTSNGHFPVVPFHVNQRTEATACATGSNRRAITSAQQLPTQIPDYQEVSMNNTNNQQIQHWQSRSYMPDSAIAFSSFVHGPRHEFSTPADTIQDAAIPTSNPDSMPEKTMLMEYPRLRYSPDCVLLKPDPGANTHRDYIWKRYP